MNFFLKAPVDSCLNEFLYKTVSFIRFSLFAELFRQNVLFSRSFQRCHVWQWEWAKTLKTFQRARTALKFHITRKRRTRMAGALIKCPATQNRKLPEPWWRVILGPCLAWGLATQSGHFLDYVIYALREPDALTFLNSALYHCSSLERSHGKSVSDVETGVK